MSSARRSSRPCLTIERRHRVRLQRARRRLYLAMGTWRARPSRACCAMLADAKDRENGLPVSVVAYVLAEVCRGFHAALSSRTGDGTGAGPRPPRRLPAKRDARLRRRVTIPRLRRRQDRDGERAKTGEVKSKTAYMGRAGDGRPLRSPERSLRRWRAPLRVPRAPSHVGRRHRHGGDPEARARVAAEPRATGRKALPAELVTLHARLVAHDREGRPATAAEVADALDAFVPDAADAQRRLEIAARRALRGTGEGAARKIDSRSTTSRRRTQTRSAKRPSAPSPRRGRPARATATSGPGPLAPSSSSARACQCSARGVERSPPSGQAPSRIRRPAVTSAALPTTPATASAPSAALSVVPGAVPPAVCRRRSPRLRRDPHPRPRPSCVRPVSATQKPSRRSGREAAPDLDDHPF